MADIFDILTNDYAEVVAFTVTADHDTPAWDTVLTMTVTGLAAGTYMMGINFLLDYGSDKDKTAWTRVTGTHFTGTEFADRATADGEHKSRFYEVVKEHAGGNMTISLEMSCGTGLSDFLVDSAQVICTRIG